MSPLSAFEALRHELRAELDALRARIVALEAENRALRAQGPPAHPLEPAEVLALQEENRRLRAERERLRRGKKNSSNSSKPPLRIIRTIRSRSGTRRPGSRTRQRSGSGAVSLGIRERLAHCCRPTPGS